MPAGNYGLIMPAGHYKPTLSGFNVQKIRQYLLIFSVKVGIIYIIISIIDYDHTIMLDGS